MLKRLERIANEKIASYVKKQDAYLSGLTMLMAHIDTAAVDSEGHAVYTTKYARSKEGFQGRVYAKGVALSKIPRRVRQVAYTGIGVRDWDIEMAYFTFAVQVADKLHPILNCPHFQMDTLRLYIRDRKFIWDSIKSTNNCLSNSDCKQLCIAVFNGGAIEDKYVDNAHLKNISREGRVMRWMATHMIPDVYEKLDIEGKKNWAEASAQSYFLAGVESRVLEALVEHCESLCTGGSGRVLDHISLQFDGAEISMRPFPMDFKCSAEKFISEKTGFKVNLVEKTHKFLLDLVSCDAESIGRIQVPDARSPLYEQGNSVLLAMYILEGDIDMCSTYEEIATCRPISGRPVRSYFDCVSYIGGCALSPVLESDLKIGGKYIIHADGRGAEPSCLPLQISKSGKAEVTASIVKYTHNLQDMREMIACAIDKPILFEYSKADSESSSSSNRGKNNDDVVLRTLLAG